MPTLDAHSTVSWAVLHYDDVGLTTVAYYAMQEAAGFEAEKHSMHTEEN